MNSKHSCEKFQHPFLVRQIERKTCNSLIYIKGKKEGSDKCILNQEKLKQQSLASLFNLVSANASSYINTPMCGMRNSKLKWKLSQPEIHSSYICSFLPATIFISFALNALHICSSVSVNRLLCRLQAE